MPVSERFLSALPKKRRQEKPLGKLSKNCVPMYARNRINALVIPSGESGFAKRKGFRGRRIHTSPNGETVVGIRPTTGDRKSRQQRKSLIGLKHCGAHLTSQSAVKRNTHLDDICIL